MKMADASPYSSQGEPTDGHCLAFAGEGGRKCVIKQRDKNKKNVVLMIISSSRFFVSLRRTGLTPSDECQASAAKRYESTTFQRGRRIPTHTARRSRQG